MKTILVRGGRPLHGTVTADGSKNAVLPLLFATLLTHGVSEFTGVPDIGDVRCALKILSAYGVRCDRPAPGKLRMDTRGVHPAEPDPADLRRLRASTYLLGAALGRFGRVRQGIYGGCAFCDRPIDLHLYAIRALGGREEPEGVFSGPLHSGVVDFPAVSVGATVNALLLAATLPGETLIRNAAAEPHILSLIAYLRAAGAAVEVTPQGYRVRGGALHGAQAAVIPDMIEAGTYLLAGLITGGDVAVRTDPSHLTSFLPVLEGCGASVAVGENSVFVSAAPGHTPPHPVDVITAPYPGFPTDLHPPLVPLLALRAGGHIRETVFPARFGYLDGLARFGIRSLGRESATHIFPSVLCPATVAAKDLRGGVAAVLAALGAHGVSRVENADIILRGYAGLCEKFRALGADMVLTET